MIAANVGVLWSRIWEDKLVRRLRIMGNVRIYENEEV